MFLVKKKKNTFLFAIAEGFGEYFFPYVFCLGKSKILDTLLMQKSQAASSQKVF